VLSADTGYRKLENRPSGTGEPDTCGKGSGGKCSGTGTRRATETGRARQGPPDCCETSDRAATRYGSDTGSGNSSGSSSNSRSGSKSTADCFELECVGARHHRSAGTTNSYCAA
jgi:hypothetical protein